MALPEKKCVDCPSMFKPNGPHQLRCKPCAEKHEKTTKNAYNAKYRAAHKNSSSTQKPAAKKSVAALLVAAGPIPAMPQPPIPLTNIDGLALRVLVVAGIVTPEKCEAAKKIAEDISRLS